MQINLDSYKYDNPILQDTAQYQENHEKRRGCRYFHQVLLNKQCGSGHKAEYVYYENNCD